MAEQKQAAGKERQRSEHDTAKQNMKGRQKKGIKASRRIGGDRERRHELYARSEPGRGQHEVRQIPPVVGKVKKRSPMH